MAITVANYITASETTNGTTLAATTTATAAVGTRLAVCFAMPDTAGAVSCADSRGNTYTKVSDVSNASGTRNVIFSAPITTQVEIGDTITVTCPSVEVRVQSTLKISDLTNGGVLDKTSTATGNSTAPASGAQTITAADEALIGNLSAYDGSVTVMSLDAVASGWTAATGLTANGLSSTVGVFPIYRVTSAVASHEASGTLNSTFQWSAAMATFYAPGTVTLTPDTAVTTFTAVDATLTRTFVLTPDTAVATFTAVDATLIKTSRMIALRNWWRRGSRRRI